MFYYGMKGQVYEDVQDKSFHQINFKVENEPLDELSGQASISQRDLLIPLMLMKVPTHKH